MAFLQLLCQISIQLLIIRHLGIGVKADIYFISQAIPYFFGAIVSSSLQNLWLPKFSIIINNLKKLEKAQNIAQAQSIILSFVATLLFAFFIYYLFPYLYTGPVSEEKNILITCSIMFLLISVINIKINLLICQLRAQSKFFISEIISIVTYVITILFLYFNLDNHGVVFAVFILCVRACLHYLFLAYISNHRILYNFFTHKIIKKEYWNSIAPIIFGSSIYKSMPTIDRHWALHSSLGGVTLLGTGQTIIGALIQILEKMLCIPVIPNFSRLSNKKEFARLRNLYRKKVTEITAIIFIFYLIFTFSKKILVIILENFMHLTIANSTMLVNILNYLFGFAYSSLIIILMSAVYYSIGDLKTPVKISIFSFCFGILLKLIFFKNYGLITLPIINSIYFICNALLLFFFIEKKINSLIVAYNK